MGFGHADPVLSCAPTRPTLTPVVGLSLAANGLLVPLDVPPDSGIFTHLSHPQRGGSRVVTDAGWDAVDAAALARKGVAGQALPVSEQPARGRTALQCLHPNFGRQHMAGRGVG
jgi:hypothetical protein